MKIGIPKEIKTHEYRVGLVPGSVRELIHKGHTVYVETNAGAAIGYPDASYAAVGAQVVSSAEALFQKADLIVKVKELQPEECQRLREGQLLFTFLHLAPDPVQAEGLIASKCSALAYETVTDPQGGFPLLSPMSEVAGRMSVQVGAHNLEISQGGPGILLGGVPGVEPARVVVLGGGVVGTNAARMALGLGAKVTIIDRSIARLQALDHLFGARIHTVYSTLDNIERLVTSADLVIGAILLPGASSPKLVTRKMIEHMRPGAVVVDVAIDQGGCFETSIPTTHEDPTFMVEGVLHYCVANIPGAVARTSTLALNHATLPFVLELAAHEGIQALQHNPYLLKGLTVHKGHITNEAAAKDLGKTYLDPLKALTL